jgi:CheY-like chemotaxis protein
MSRSVLVVDDDQAIRETLCELLADDGYRAVGAANGREALELLRSGERPSIILLDLMMPVMDGFAFRTAQLADPALRAIPVAVITAMGQPSAASIDVDVVLSKPLRIEKVIELVERFCPPGG